MISPVKIWRRQKQISRLLGKRGTVITWTKITVASQEFKKFAPFPVVIVKLSNGNKAVGQLVDYKEADLKIGTKVIAVLRKTKEGEREDVIAYGIKFKPLYPSYAGLQPKGLSKQLRGSYTRANSFVSGIF
jgi:hypothetical protein